MSDTVGIGGVFTFVFACLLIAGFIVGLWLGVSIERVYCRDVHVDPMEALGIEKFQRCEINTTNCHSNWYEIVWKEEHHK